MDVPPQIEEVARAIATKVGQNIGSALLAKGERTLTDGQLAALQPVFATGFRSAVAAGVAVAADMRPEAVQWAKDFLNPPKPSRN